MEGLEHAQQVCDLVATYDDVECLLWTSIFEPGFLTFEALEKMLLQCCAAVFIASPDDCCTIRGRDVRSPRANVMLEFGLVAGRLERHNIAVCQYGGAELPTDLQGLTVIPMDPPLDASDAKLFRERAQQKLKIWSLRMLSTAERIPRTHIVHGYTGRWSFSIALQTWRDLVVQNSDYAQVKGYFDLFIPASGQTGRGLAHGHLYFKIQDTSSGSGLYQGEFQTVHEVTNAICYKDGSLVLTTEVLVLKCLRSEGAPPPQLTEVSLFPEPFSAHWRLSPTQEPRTLEGTFQAEGAVATQGSIKATKTPEIA
jgi:hypothetical protein